MRYLSLFSGIEAATVAWKNLGFTPVAFSEIAPYPCAVLQHHYPSVPNFGDVTKITESDIKKLDAIDLVVFGSPCTDLSVAGKRKGFIDENGKVTRSGLFDHAINIIGWARKHCGTRFALWENVPGAFSSNKGRDFAAVVEKMAGLRNFSQPKNGWGTEGCAVGDNGMLEWAVLDAQWFGVPQRRKRVFAVVDFGNWASRPPILLERRSLRGNFKSSVEKTPSITKRVSTDFEKLYAVHGHIIGRKPNTGGNGLGISDDICPTLTATDKHAIAFRVCGQDGFTPSYISPPILASDGGGAGVPAVMHNSVVRYLTVTECARLMGFSDDYLTVEFNGKQPSKRQQYMALGNSMAVPVMKYVGERIINAIN